MSLFRSKKSSNNEPFITPEETTHSFLLGLTRMMVDDGYAVVSIIDLSVENEGICIQEYRHILFRKEGTEILQLDNHMDNYLLAHDFNRYFAERMNPSIENCETMVTLKLFKEEPSASTSTAGPFKSYVWDVHEFIVAAPYVRAGQATMPPRIFDDNGIPQETPHPEPAFVFDNKFVYFVTDNDTTVNVSELFENIIKNADNGIHAFTCYWEEDNYHEVSYFRKDQGNIHFLKNDNVMDLLRHNIMMGNVQARINRGKLIHIFLQSFSGSDIVPLLCGWSIEDNILGELNTTQSEEFLDNGLYNEIDNLRYMGQKGR